MSETDRRTNVAGVIGWPVAHSLSPKLHRYWRREYGIEGAYVPLAVRPEDFSVVVHALPRGGFAGVNVTLPHKEAAFALAHEHDDPAAATRAANLLIFSDGRIQARNTDVYGFRTSLTEALGPDALRGAAAVVLGAGGAARAAVLALDQLGVASVQILNRSQERAASLVSELASRIKSSLQLVQQSDWKNVARHTAIVVNATRAGQSGEGSWTLPFDLLPAGCVVCDLVYNPLETEFLERARQRGLKTVDGLGMLMHQAVPSFAAFFGQMPAVTPALRSELEQALRA